MLRAFLAAALTVVILSNSYPAFAILDGKPLASDPVTRGMYRHLVTLSTGDDQIFCQGVLIRPTFVLTAAHCFSQDRYKPKVKLALDESGKKFEFVKIVGKRLTETAAAKKKFDGNGEDYDASRFADLAVVQIARVPKFVQPIAILDKGLQQELFQTSKLLRSIGFTHVDYKLANVASFTAGKKINPMGTMSGAYLMFQQDLKSCRGDSGGPLVLQIETPGEPAKFVLVGLQSGVEATPEEMNGPPNSRYFNDDAKKEFPICGSGSAYYYASYGIAQAVDLMRALDSKLKSEPIELPVYKFNAQKSGLEPTPTIERFGDDTAVASKSGEASLAKTAESKDDTSANAEKAGGWYASLAPNEQFSAPVYWSTTRELASEGALRACKKVSKSCSTRPAWTDQRDDVFSLMCCKKPKLGCAVGVGRDQESALQAVRNTFSDSGYTKCQLWRYVSARTGEDIKASGE